MEFRRVLFRSDRYADIRLQGYVRHGRQKGLTRRTETRRRARTRMLAERERRFLVSRRVGHLATADPQAAPHVVPVCFAIADRVLYVTIDEKPKRAGARLKRLRNIDRKSVVYGKSV